MAMTNEEAVAKVNETNATLAKVGGETQRLLDWIAKLEQALKDAGGVGGTITAELESAINGTSQSANNLDSMVSDEVATPLKKK